MKYNVKIIALLSGVAVLITVVAFASFRAYGHIEDSSEARRHTNEVIGRAHGLLASLVNAETGERGYLLTGDPQFLQPYLAVRDSINDQLMVLSRLITIDSARIHIMAIPQLVDLKMAEIARLIEYRRFNKVAIAAAMVKRGEGQRLMDSIRNEIASIDAIESAVLAEHEREYQANMKQLFTVIIAAGLLMVLLALSFAYLMYRETRHKLKQLVHNETVNLLHAQEETNKKLQWANFNLQISEEKFEVTLNSIGDAVIATDAEGCVTILNPLAEHLTGWTQTEAFGRPIEDIFHIINQDTRQPSVIPIKQVLEHGTKQGLANHTVLISRTLDECAIADSCAPIIDRDGKVVGAVLVFRDVTKEYAVQKSLRESEDRSNKIFEESSIGVITINEDLHFTRTNIAFQQMLGYTNAELRMMTFKDVTHPEYVSKDIEYVNKLLAGTIQVYETEKRYIRKDGDLIWGNVKVTLHKSEKGEFEYFLVMVEDINERKLTEDKLLKAGPLQNAIFNSANFSSIATDANGVIQIFNVGAERMLGYSAADVMNKITPADISDPQEVIIRAKALSVELSTTITPGFEALVFKASRGIEDIYELTYIRKDGSRFPAVVSVTALRDEQNTIIGYLLIGTDNTARKQAEEALLKAGALQSAIFNSANFSSIATDAKGVIQIFNVGAERMLGYKAADVMNKITPADISDPQEVIIRAKALSVELSTEITPGFEALVFKAKRGIEDIYELTYIRKDGSRFPAVVSVTALRDEQNSIIGYLLIGTDNTARKHAEEALLKASALQSAIFNSANFSSIATDANGVIQIFNVGAERMLGYKAADVMNKITPADISDPQEVIIRAKALSVELSTEIAPGFEALVFKAKRGIEDIYELTYIRKDGSRFPAVVSVTALRDELNAIIGYLLIGTDNTARKQAEEALLKAGALQSAIFNSANFSSIATDANGVIQIFNVGAERMLGYKAADVMNKITPADISDPQEVIIRAKALSDELSTEITPGFEALVFKAKRGIEDIYELTYIRKDGSRFPAVVSVTALRDEQNTIIGYLLIGTDNTARKQIEAEQKVLAQKLRDHQFYTRSLFEANIDALMTTDPSGIITDVNKQMEVLTDSTRDELIGAPFKRYFTDPELAQASIDQVLNEKKLTNYELTARTRDGKETVVSYNATTFYDRDRKLQGVFAAARDITERKQLDQVLLEKNIELENSKSVSEKANLAKSNFLSSMSHELRSPLNAILGFAQLMQTAVPLPTNSQKDSITQILQAGWHLLKLINEVLDLAVVESGKVSLSQEPVSLGEVISECEAMFVPEGHKRNIKMIFPEFYNPMFVLADRTRLKQVFINLLSNAIKYNREHGTVEVKCTPSTPNHILISVKDTGPGMNPDQVKNLFQPFNRLGQENSGIEGTGIGLSTSKRLVELMGGLIGVQSNIGTGSVFWFEMISADPVQIEGEKAELVIAMPAAASKEGHQSTLLYVEDNPANMKLVGELIDRRSDVRLLRADNGNLGVELALKHLPDVILMDINLPGISGIQALKLLRENITTMHIPVVALSANAMPRDIKNGLDAGFFRYLTKPIKVNEFMSTLNESLLFSEKTLSRKHEEGLLEV